MAAAPSKAASEAAETQRRDLRKFWIAVGIIVAIGILFVWWSVHYPLLNE